MPWKQVEGIRHILVHHYFRVDWEIVYTTAKMHLPSFRPLVETMLRELSPDDDSDLKI